AVLLAGLAREINAALDNKMYVVISYHVIGWPNGWYQAACCGNAADTYDSTFSVATSFWTQMAQTYGSDTRVIFDLWNEPVHDATDWNDVTYWADLKPFYESLIQTVRGAGAQNIVLAAGSGWASWLGGIKDNPLTDSNVVYAYHKYSVNGLNTPSQWNKDTGGLIGVKPVIVSEWGYEDSDVANPTWAGSQASYGDPFTQWMDNNRLGNLAWMYHHDWTPALLKADGTFTLYGTFVKRYLTSAAVAVRSVGANDGWILESGENSNAGGVLNAISPAFYIGDVAAKRQFRGILHFNTSALPDNAVITKAVLRMMKSGARGNTSTLGALLVDMTKPSFGAAALALPDFQTAAGRPNIFNPFVISGSWYNAALKSAGFAYVNRLGTTQFRLRFARDDDNDNIADYLMFYSGDVVNAANRPQLVIQYYVP
ncbi:MAG: cellulase family glycosylhydrolase, partial [Anaerolineales bacterium]|nr:cellulase family glycosylhydrolase [Anaerolineales bacterium]